MKKGILWRFNTIFFVFLLTAAVIGCGSGSGSGSGQNTSPTATIISPSDGDTYSEGDPITFIVSGSDAEDGSLSSSSLVWTSSIDGPIGTGTSFIRNDLSVGTHTITVIATDSEGATGNASVLVNISSTSETTVYYVSTQGNDNNGGLSEETAFQTIARALQAVQPGDTIQVLAGTYSETLQLENFGNSRAPITLKGEGDASVLDGRSSMALGFWCEMCTNLIIENLEIRNFTDIGIGVYLSSVITMRNLKVHDNGFAVQLKGWELEGYGIDVDECNKITIEGNDVYKNGPDPQLPELLMGTGINTFKCTDCTILNNQSHHNIGGGILVEDGINVLVEGNNVFSNNLDASADGWWDGGLWVDGGHDIIIRNNIFTGNLGPGIEISDEDFQNPYGYVLENNISTENYFGIYLWNFGTNDWPSENILRRSENQFSGNTRQDIWIVDWE